MSRSFFQFRGYIDDLLKEESQEDILNRLKKEKQALWHEGSQGLFNASAGNIENFVGSVQMPVGIAGPLRVRGLFADGLYHIPLATTGATLVASCNRGARTLAVSGGCTAALLSEGVSRAPGTGWLPEPRRPKG